MQHIKSTPFLLCSAGSLVHSCPQPDVFMYSIPMLARCHSSCTPTSVAHLCLCRCTASSVGHLSHCPRSLPILATCHTPCTVYQHLRLLTSLAQLLMLVTCHSRCISDCSSVYRTLSSSCLCMCTCSLLKYSITCIWVCVCVSVCECRALCIGRRPEA